MRLLAMAGMAFASWWGISWLAARNIYFPAFPRSVHSIFQLLALLVFLLLAARLCLEKLRSRSAWPALAVFNGCRRWPLFSSPTPLCAASISPSANSP